MKSSNLKFEFFFAQRLALGSKLSNELLPLSQEPSSKLLARKACLCGKNYNVSLWVYVKHYPITQLDVSNIPPDERSVNHCQMYFPYTMKSEITRYF